MSATRTETAPRTVAAAFAATVARHGDREWLCVLPETAAVFGIEPCTWTYAEAAAEVARLRDAYTRAGCGHGHRAGLLLLNRPEFLFHFVALNSLGTCVVPINPEWRSGELEFLLEHSEIDIAAVIPERTADLRSAAAAVGRRLVITGPAGEGIAALERSPPAADQMPGTDTECALLYTSGTTGRPKGCVLTNQYFLYAGEWYAKVGGLCDVRPGVERMITPLPLTHMNAFACSTMCMILTGGCLILLDRFHPGSWWDSVRTSRATIVHYLGVMPAMLLAAPASDADRRHDVRFGFGAGVGPRHHAAFEFRFGFPLLEAWAMTETGSGAVVIANREPRQVGTACFGTPASDVECRIVDDEGGDVGVDVPGELLVRHAGPEPRFGFFREYLKDPDATAAAWQGGWFHTGDVVRRDASGAFHFVDRKKNVIRRSGENISAVEVEGVLAQHPAVSAVGVAAVPDDVRGDEVFACIVVRPDRDGDAVLARELTEWCLSRLAYFKAPGYLAFVRELPLTTTAKIQRGSLKVLAHRLHAEGACIDLRSMKRRQHA